jgi:hypothetical protein
MIHPQTEVRLFSSPLGRGVVATAPLPLGTVVWVRDPLDAGWAVDEVMRWPEVYRPLLHRTCLVIGDEVVQPWDDARYMNHSCEPSCGGTVFGFEVALHDIAPGEPLTNDYDGFGLPGEPSFPCRCGAASCRGEDVFHAPDTARRHLAEALTRALAAVHCVPQPLTDLLHSGRLERAIASVAHGTSLNREDGHSRRWTRSP